MEVDEHTPETLEDSAFGFSMAEKTLLALFFCSEVGQKHEATLDNV
jgi:hypothetical protein